MNYSAKLSYNHHDLIHLLLECFDRSKEFYEQLSSIQEILATLEELANQQGLKRIEKGLGEYKKKEHMVAPSPEKIKETLMKD